MKSNLRSSMYSSRSHACNQCDALPIHHDVKTMHRSHYYVINVCFEFCHHWVCLENEIDVKILRVFLALSCMQSVRLTSIMHRSH